jgi:hypothetical protein
MSLDRTVLRAGLQRGLRTSLTLAKFILPAYVAVDFLGSTPVLPALGRLCAPLMQPLGLPGEAAMALVLGSLLNLYAAIGILAPMGLSAGQLTLCALMLGLAHSLVVETTVLKALGTRYVLLTVYRLILAVAVGLTAAPWLT